MSMHIKYYLSPLLYLLSGSVITVALLRALLDLYATPWLILLVPMLLITLFVTIVGIVNVWVQYRTGRDSDVYHRYTFRELLWLYVRCFVVVVAGVVLALVFHLMIGVAPDHVQRLVRHWSLLYYCLCGFLTCAALLSIVRGENLQEIRLRNAQSENFVLKSQLNPHFLYNTLNNIDALIWLDPARASEAVVRLSGLMRYLTYSARLNEVPVSGEVEHLRELVSLQQLRMTTPGALTLEVAIDDAGAVVAPLLLMPLVENTFKHCHTLDRPHAIDLRLDVAQGALHFVASNSIAAPAESADAAMRGGDKKTSGVGLTVLRRRLQLLYPGRFVLTTGVTAGRFVADLRITMPARRPE